MKRIFTVTFILFSCFAKAQKIESIHVNLYTDSLKKGTYNYINVDGLLSTGKYVPLDSSSINFWASDGEFHGNSLLIDKEFKKEKVSIKVSLKDNPSVAKDFTMFIKKKEDNEKLKTSDELLKEMQSDAKVKHKRKA